MNIFRPQNNTNLDYLLEKKTDYNTEKNKITKTKNIEIFKQNDPNCDFWNFTIIDDYDRLMLGELFNKFAKDVELFVVTDRYNDAIFSRNTTIYFSDLKRSLHKFCKGKYNYRIIKIKQNAQINIIGCGTFKAHIDDIVYSETRSIFDNNFILKKILKYSGTMIKNIERQTDELCEIAVMHDGRALAFVVNKTDKICKLAVINNGLALQYVPEETPELCMLAVQENEKALRLVQKQYLELCMAAVEKDGNMLEYVDEKFKTPEICTIAVNQTPFALQYATYQDKDMCIKAVKKFPYLSKYVRYQSDDKCSISYV